MATSRSWTSCSRTFSRPLSRGIDVNEAFCSDLDPDTATWLEDLLGPEPQNPLEKNPTRVAGPPEIPSTYILLEQDEVLLPAYQLEHAKRVNAGEIVRMEAGHSAFASQPEALSALLLGYAG